MAPAPLPPKQVALRWRRCAWIIYVMMITVITARSIYAFVVVCMTADTPPTSQQTMLNGFDSWPEFYFETWFAEAEDAKPVFYWAPGNTTNVSIRNSQVVFQFPPSRVANVTDAHPLLVAYSVSSQNMTKRNLPVVAMNYNTTDGPVTRNNVAMLPVSCGDGGWKTTTLCKTIGAVFMKIRKNQMVDSDLYWKHAFQSHTLTFESVAHPVDEYHAMAAVNAPVLMDLVDNVGLKDFNQRLFNLSDASAPKEDFAYVMIYVQADSRDAIRVSTHSFVSRSITIFGCAGGYGSLVSVMLFLLFRAKKERELPDEDLLVPLFADETSGTDSDSEEPSLQAVGTQIRKSPRRKSPRL